MPGCGTQLISQLSSLFSSNNDSEESVTLIFLFPWPIIRHSAEMFKDFHSSVRTTCFLVSDTGRAKDKVSGIRRLSYKARGSYNFYCKVESVNVTFCSL